MKIRWSSRARLNLIEIGDYIARNNPSTALDWILTLEEKAEQAASHPLAGRKVPELDREDVREVFLKTYRIVYQVFDDRIEVAQVFEGHRLLRILPPGEQEKIPGKTKESQRPTSKKRRKKINA